MAQLTCTSPVHQILQTITKEVAKGGTVTLDKSKRAHLCEKFGKVDEAEKKRISRGLIKISESYAISRVNDQKGRLDQYEVNLKPTDDGAIITAQQLQIIAAMLLEVKSPSEFMPMDDFEALLRTVLVGGYGVEIDYDNLREPEKEMLYSICANHFGTSGDRIQLYNRFKGSVHDVIPVEILLQHGQLFLRGMYQNSLQTYWFNLSKKWDILDRDSEVSRESYAS